MALPLISIIVPVFNSEKYLERCLSSIKDQTYKNLEIIVIDDGSTDGSLQIINDFQTIDNRFIVINQNNKGPGSARNKGLQIAKGDYLAFVDSDDWIDLDMIHIMYDALKINKCDIAVCKLKQVYNQTIVYNKKKYKSQVLDKTSSLRNLLTVDWGFYSCNKMFKASLLNNIRYPEGVYFEDIRMIYKPFCRSEKNVFISEGLYFYTQRADSTTRTNSPSKMKNEIEAFEKLWKEPEFNNLKKELSAIFLTALIKIGSKIKSNNVIISKKEVVNKISVYCQDKYLNKKDKIRKRVFLYLPGVYKIRYIISNVISNNLGFIKNIYLKYNK